MALKEKSKSKNITAAKDSTKKPTPSSRKAVESEEEAGSEFSDEEEIGEESLQKVITLLGDDGLDDVGQMQLGLLNGTSTTLTRTTRIGKIAKAANPQSLKTVKTKTRL